MIRVLLVALAIVTVALTACIDLKSLRRSDPIQPIRDYERLMVGDLNADYIGNDNCLAKCHVHDQIARDFAHSIHSEQIAADTGLPLVNCESCHGPGSLAVKNAEKTGKCDTGHLLPIEKFPAQAQSMICLKCHSAASTPSLTFWNASPHASSDVSCFDCHRLHRGPAQKASREEVAELCYGCHQDIRSRFSQTSHHPVPEQKVACIDCHDPHGSLQEHLLKGSTVRETCSRCHMDKQGPFVYEHADVTETCTNCHRPHGSPNDPLLNQAQPFLCLQCHPGHLGQDFHSNGGALSSTSMKQLFYNRCTDCHSAIHGTDIPSPHGRGTFITR
ncbi:DmsE family decaheme c-type cytochrome [Geothermobacter ehrlichii]|uniref:DmsE family decaheme c-type cytochrome n=1 Tax=Geothermobacter ehrlichii TaxID=213224 RepID=UPI001FEBDE98|nr:DmsE family decaheme c-type cytochrome [Geothermobacter ehrlichii]